LLVLLAALVAAGAAAAANSAASESQSNPCVVLAAHLSKRDCKLKTNNGPDSPLLPGAQPIAGPRGSSARPADALDGRKEGWLAGWLLCERHRSAGASVANLIRAPKPNQDQFVHRRAAEL